MPTHIDKNAKRRVPDALRRRAMISCDRCKARRSRCVRLHDSEPCASCVNGGYQCESTLPRKQRLYGSVESLSYKYRVLDALVKGLFPSEDTTDVRTLVRLAEERQISMPTDEDNRAEPGPTSSTDRILNTHNARGNVRSSSRTNTASGEKLIPAPHGVPHYIGPASTFEFATAIRKLVARYNSVMGPSSDDTDQQRLRTDFATMKVSIALEPRVHPTLAADDEEDRTPGSKTEPMSISTNQPDILSTPSPGSSIFANSHHLLDILPPRETTDELVEAFFNHTHPNYILFHRGSFQTQYESIWEDDQNHPDSGWSCSLLMVLAFGAQVIEGYNPDQAIVIQKRSLKFIRERFHRLAFTASLSNVQALSLLQLFEYNAGERNTAWLHLGQATRMAIALGMHREGTNGIFEPVERNSRRIVWYTLYSFENHLSLALGRPLIIDPSEVNCLPPDQNLMDGGDFPPSYLQYFAELINLSIRVRAFVSMVSTKTSQRNDLYSTCLEAEKILSELQSWMEMLPHHLSPNLQLALPKHRRAVLLMHICYHHLRSVICRPYLLHAVNLIVDVSTAIDHQTMNLFDAQTEGLIQQCMKSASSITDYLQQLEDESLLDGVTWLDFYYVYHNMLVMSLVVLLTRQNGNSSEEAPGPYVKSIQKMMQLCYQNRLAQTYQILLRVAFQFAQIVGVAPNAPSISLDLEHLAAASDGRVDTSNEGTAPDQAMASYLDDQFMPFPNPLGLYCTGNDDLDLNYFASSGEFGFAEYDSQDLPPPTVMVDEPGLLVYGNSNPYRR